MRPALAALLIAACSGEPATVPTATAPPSTPVASVPASPPVAAAETELPYGEIFELEPDTSGGDVVVARMLVVEGPRIPRPDAAPIGYAMVHGGYWEIRPVSESPSPYATVGVASEDGPCDARVVRARTLYASMSDETEEDPDRRIETSFSALELEGCSGGFGVAGRSVRTTELDASSAPAATPARRAQIAAYDEAFVDESHLDASGEVRAMEFPAHHLAVVFGHRTWLLRDDVVSVERNGGEPAALVEAGDRLFVIVTSPSEGWMSPLSLFDPAPSE